MKKYLIPLGLIMTAGVLFSLGYFTKPLLQHLYQNKVLVTVNEQPITDRDLQQEISFLRVSENTPMSNITKEDVLDRLINDQLILQEAKKLDLAIQVDQFKVYAQDFWKPYSDEARKKILRTNGLTMETWEALVKKRLLIEQTMAHMVDERVHVGEDEIEAYYWTHLLEFYRPVRVHARQIVVETEAQAKTLKAQLDKGDNFQVLASQFSRGPEKDQGGDLGWVSADDLPQAFTKVLFRLKEHDISKPIATTYGYHIFTVDQREQGGRISMEEAKKEIAENLKLTKTNQVFQNWLEEIRTRANISFNN